MSAVIPNTSVIKITPEIFDAKVSELHLETLSHSNCAADRTQLPNWWPPIRQVASRNRGIEDKNTDRARRK